MSKHEPKSDSIAGGALLALAILAGAAIGIALGQPMIGAVAGTAIGAAIALAMRHPDGFAFRSSS